MIYKIWIILLLTLTSLSAQGQYRIDDFSDEYYVKLTVTQHNPNSATKKGILCVWSKKDNTKVLDIKLEAFTIDLNQKIKESGHYPYAKQKVLIYEDFNFDGKKDIAIQNDMNGCYQGLSYQIFLKDGQTFKWNKDFTQLAQRPYCGMFEVNRFKKQLKTFYKSGCCLHSAKTYEIKHNIPVEVSEIIEHYDPLTKTKTITSKKWVDGKLVSTQKKTPEKINNTMKQRDLML